MKLSESIFAKVRNDFLNFFDNEKMPVNYYGILFNTWLNAYNFYKGKEMTNKKIVKKAAKKTAKTAKKPAKKPVKK